MHLTNLVDHVLQTGTLPMKMEQEIYKLLDTGDFSEGEIPAIEALLDAIARRDVRPIA